MVFNFLGSSVELRDYTGASLSIYRYGDTPGLIDSDTPNNVKPLGHSNFSGSLVFSDEFKTSSLDVAKWEPHYPDTAFWNSTVPGGHLTNTNEPQGYDLSGITFDGDGMVLTMREESTSVPELSYTSGMISSYPSFSQTYGYFEARLLLPNADDSWPAFWLFPADMSWPPEIDIVENDGKASFNLQTYHTFHYPRPIPGGNSSAIHEYSEDVGNAWHVYGALWETDRIRWYVDGDMVHDLSIQPEHAAKDMFIICNLAGKQESSPVTPFSMRISHIRAWSL